MVWYNALADLSINEGIQPLGYKAIIVRGENTHDSNYKNDFVWCLLKDNKFLPIGDISFHGYKEVLLSNKLISDLSKGYKLIHI